MKIVQISLLSLCGLLCSITWTFAAGTNVNDFNIIPEAKSEDRSKDVSSLWSWIDNKSFRDRYNELGRKYDTTKGGEWDVGASFASGIFTWDTILLFVIRIGKRVANVALVAGAACVIYAGYLYVLSAFSVDKTTDANDAIKAAAFGILVITMSYGFMRILIAMFL
jgi:hypothetical protein